MEKGEQAVSGPALNRLKPWVPKTGPRPCSQSASPDQTSGDSVSAALRAQRRRRTGPSSPRAVGTGRPQQAVRLSRGPSLACRLTRNDRLGFSSIYSPTVMTSLIGHEPSGKGVL